MREARALICRRIIVRPGRLPTAAMAHEDDPLEAATPIPVESSSPLQVSYKDFLTLTGFVASIGAGAAFTSAFGMATQDSFLGLEAGLSDDETKAAILGVARCLALSGSLFALALTVSVGDALLMTCQVCPTSHFRRVLTSC
jgi:hypothetical protein